MVTSKVAFKANTAVERVKLFEIGIPSTKRFEIRDIRLQFSVFIDVKIYLIINGEQRMEMLPSLYETIYDIYETIEQGGTIEVWYESAVNTASNVGVALYGEYQ
jgi:hypothetical protein